MSRVLTVFMRSMPRDTTAPAAIAATAPKRGTPAAARRTYSLPAIMAAADEKEATVTPVSTAVPEGSAPVLPAVMNSAASSPMNRAERATHAGAVSPKNTAISLPEANPAPIIVPI